MRVVKVVLALCGLCCVPACWLGVECNDSLEANETTFTYGNGKPLGEGTWRFSLQNGEQMESCSLDVDQEGKVVRDGCQASKNSKGQFRSVTLLHFGYKGETIKVTHNDEAYLLLEDYDSYRSNAPQGEHCEDRNWVASVRVPEKSP